jgi:hypothetical protein
MRGKKREREWQVVRGLARDGTRCPSGARSRPSQTDRDFGDARTSTPSVVVKGTA